MQKTIWSTRIFAPPFVPVSLPSPRPLLFLFLFVRTTKHFSRSDVRIYFVSQGGCQISVPVTILSNPSIHYTYCNTLYLLLDLFFFLSPSLFILCYMSFLFYTQFFDILFVYSIVLCLSDTRRFIVGDSWHKLKLVVKRQFNIIY